MMSHPYCSWIFGVVVLFAASPAMANDTITVTDWKGTRITVTSGFVSTNGLKLHYVTAGQGPLVMLMGGAGGFWGDLRNQIPALAASYKVVGLDLRGHNLSDAPAGAQNYHQAKLVEDIDGAIKAFGYDKAILIGHDLGGMVAWSYAMAHPERTALVVTIDALHPRALIRELAVNPTQVENAAYVRSMQESPTAAEEMRRQRSVVPSARPGEDAGTRAQRIEAARRTSTQAVVDWYRVNYPRPPYTLDSEGWGSRGSAFPQVKAPTLTLKANPGRGLQVGGVKDLWAWVDSDLTIVTKGIGHNMMEEDPAWVNRTILSWLADHTVEADSARQTGTN